MTEHQSLTSLLSGSRDPGKDPSDKPAKNRGGCRGQYLDNREWVTSATGRYAANVGIRMQVLEASRDSGIFIGRRVRRGR